MRARPCLVGPYNVWWSRQVEEDSRGPSPVCAAHCCASDQAAPARLRLIMNLAMFDTVDIWRLGTWPDSVCRGRKYISCKVQKI